MNHQCAPPRPFSDQDPQKASATDLQRIMRQNQIKNGQKAKKQEFFIFFRWIVDDDDHNDILSVCFNIMFLSEQSPCLYTSSRSGGGGGLSMKLSMVSQRALLEMTS